MKPFGIPNPQSRIQGPEPRTPNPESRIPKFDLGLANPKSQSQFRGSGFTIRKSQIPNPESRIPNPGIGTGIWDSRIPNHESQNWIWALRIQNPESRSWDWDSGIGVRELKKGSLRSLRPRQRTPNWSRLSTCCFSDIRKPLENEGPKQRRKVFVTPECLVCEGPSHGVREEGRWQNPVEQN